MSPKLYVVTQPAHSPDLNLNDLSFFRALDTTVRKQRRDGDGNTYDKDQLATDVETAWRAYPSESIEDMWQYKAAVMHKIIEVDGGNDYERHRNKTTTSD